MPRTTLLAVILATALLTACATVATVTLTMPPAASAGSSDAAVLRQIRGTLNQMEADIGYEPRTTLLGELQEANRTLSRIYARQAFVCRALAAQPYGCPSPIG